MRRWSRFLAVAVVAALLALIGVTSTRSDEPSGEAHERTSEVAPRDEDDLVEPEPRVEPAHVDDVAEPAARRYRLEVVDGATGEPIAEAGFWAWYASGLEPPLGRRLVDENPRTDASGRVVFELAGSVPSKLTAYVRGYHPVDEPPPALGEIRRFVLWPALGIGGYVVDPDDGSRVEGVRVRIARDETEQLPWDDSDADGSFWIEVPEPGRWRVYVADSNEPLVVFAPTDDLVVEAPPARRIRLVDPSGRPVGSGLVTVDRHFVPRPVPPSGDLVVRLPVSSIELQELPAPLGGGAYPLPDGDGTIEIESAVPVAARVVGEGGAPVAEARVRLGRGRRWTPSSVATTDADGRFEIRALRAGTKAVLTVEPPTDALRDARRAVVVGEEIADVELSVGDVSALRVVDEAGRPVVGASVEIEPVEHDTMWHVDDRRRGRTDAEGRVRFRDLWMSDAWRVDVTPDRESSLCPVELRWEPSDVPLTIVVRRGRVLRGVVVDEAGRPVRGAELRVRDSGREVHAASDGDGRFDAGLVLGEELAVRAWHDFNDREETDWTSIEDPAGDVRVVLPSLPSLEVDVPAEARGRDLVWVDEAPLDDDVSFDDYEWGLGGSWRFRRTAVPSSGPVVLSPIDPAASYTLWMPIRDRDEHLLASGVRGDAGHVSLALTKGATLSGRIVSKHEIVRVMAVRRGLRVVTRVDAANRFAFRGLPPGAWRLFVEADEIAVPFDVRTGEPLRLEVDLEDW